MKASLRISLATLVGSVALSIAPTAFAAGEMCYNDTDCPNPECGGDVCDWGTRHPMATDTSPMPYTCVPAGTDPKGSDGWCSNTTTHEHCKCKALGAQCKTVYCTFTKPDQAPPGAGTGGTGAGGTGAVTAGTTSAAGTTTTAGTGSTSKPPADEGGCSVSAPGGANTPVALGVGLLGLGLAFALRRRG